MAVVRGKSGGGVQVLRRCRAAFEMTRCRWRRQTRLAERRPVAGENLQARAPVNRSLLMTDFFLYKKEIKIQIPTVWRRFIATPI